MLQLPLDKQLMERLADVSELALGGFSVQKGLTGAGVTVLKGRTYFGSWRVTAGNLVWVYANVGEPNHFVDSVEEAVHHTMLLILKNLQNTYVLRSVRAAS